MKNQTLFTSEKDYWETPQALFNQLDREFHFTLDPCSTHENAKCQKHFTIVENGLLKSFLGGRQCSVTRLTDETIQVCGLKNAILKRKNQIQQLCY